MLFNSVPFIFVFLPVAVIGYFILAKIASGKFSKIWLIICSLFFYAYWNPIYIFLIIGSMIVNFSISKCFSQNLNRKIRKGAIVLGILFNIGLLGYFKYVDFFIKNINAVFKTEIALLHIMLPLAISFFTFQQIAYLVDRYKGNYTDPKLSTYLLFVTFFPQLIAGPIVHHKEMMPQFENEENKRLNWDNIARGLFIFIIGLTKKVAIADTVAIWANAGFQNYENLSTIDAWLTSLSYTTQLYFDFSGYCDMAIGIGLLFNIKLPVNFFSPYKARNIQDFWNRWHMTLTRFLTHYIYIPLGGNRNGISRTYINILIVFFISGVWHGAGWTFIIWGMLHGIASVIVRLMKKINLSFPWVVSWFLTFIFVNTTWVYFRATSFDQANTIIKKMFLFEYNYEYPIRKFFNKPMEIFASGNEFDFILFHLDNPKIIVASLFVLLLISFIGRNSIELLEGFKTNLTNIAFVQLLVAITLVVIFFINKNSEFLYFNF
ncbi:MBOAT family O-acyltransferase [Gracilibacillus saliphilus]|uniref:MBOAT family O-acyltransferase n=1 Tax=Gracilibacillus saliphilus TaxID=543890 RepID=UPI0013D346E8|nr:MBOAT family O-acyltransferase [Gracilibacillus saliphilus]